MIERQRNKCNDYGRAISDLTRYSWNELLNKLQVDYTFIYQSGTRFSWNNGHARHVQSVFKNSTKEVATNLE